MVSSEMARRLLIALAIGLVLLLSQNQFGIGSYHTMAQADAPAHLMIQVSSATDITTLSNAYQLQVLDSIPVLAIYLVQAPTAATIDMLAADEHVIAVQHNDPLSTFNVQHRPANANDIEAMQRYFGFGNGDDDDDHGHSGKKDAPPDQVLVIYDDQAYKKEWLDWGLRKIRLDKTRKYATGTGITVAILDTGVDLDHPLLMDHLGTGYDFVDGDMWANDEPNGLDDDGDGLTDEGTGHGTHIANLVAMVAPDATILPIRVLNSDGSGTLYDIVQGLIYAVDQGAEVVNMSFSATENSPFLAAAVQHAIANDVLLVAAAAGGDGYLAYPSAYDQVIAVGATEKGDHITTFSEAYAAEVDIFAPGELIYSAYYDGRMAWWTGTSMAAPFVAGGAALMLDRCNCPPEMIAPILLGEVKDVKPKIERRGRMDLEKAIKKTKPNMSWCDVGKPQALTFLYTGESCVASRNGQGNKFTCDGTPSSNPATITIEKDAKKLYPSATSLYVDDLITFYTNEKKLKSTLKLNLSGQLLEIATSCSAPLEIGDQFGSLQLVDYLPEGATAAATVVRRQVGEQPHHLFLPVVIR